MVWMAGAPQLIPAQLALLLLGLPLFAPLRGLLHATPLYRGLEPVSLPVLFHPRQYGSLQQRGCPLACIDEIALSLCWLVGGILYLRYSNRLQ